MECLVDVSMEVASRLGNGRTAWIITFAYDFGLVQSQGRPNGSIEVNTLEPNTGWRIPFLSQKNSKLSQEIAVLTSQSANAPGGIE